MLNVIEANSYSGRSLSVCDSNRSLPRHRWYEIKEGFSEALVLEAIKDISKTRQRPRILDPFAGSGTTVVTAARQDLRATGIEVNPFLAFVARAKCTKGGWRRTAFHKRLETVLKVGKCEVHSPLEGLSTFTEHPGTSKWLFNRSVLRGFHALDRAIAREGSVYQGGLRLALFSSLMDCCNAKRDGKCLRYRKDWQALGHDSKTLRDRFVERVRIVQDDAEKDPLSSPEIDIRLGDTRDALRSVARAGYDLVITSPPYLNSFDYSDVYRPELFAGGFVSSNQELRKVRLKTIRSHVQVEWEPSDVVASLMLPPLLERLGSSTLWNPRLPKMVQAYFADMQMVLRRCARAIRAQGQAWIVVSTSAYGGIEIPVDLILADIASRSGWTLRGVYVLRKLRAAGQQWGRLKPGAVPPLRESLIILDRALDWQGQMPK